LLPKIGQFATKPQEAGIRAAWFTIRAPTQPSGSASDPLYQMSQRLLPLVLYVATTYGWGDMLTTHKSSQKLFNKADATAPDVK